KTPGGVEPGLEAINARALWDMGYTGNGRIAMTYDTGVWTDHPAHEDRFLANRMPILSTWFAYDSPIPTDKPSSHGSHVTGIMLGLEEETADTIGVAPRAYFIATDPIVSNTADIKPLTDLMFGFEWSLNPDGDESTSDDVPDVINNSWGRSNDNPDWDVCPEFVVPVFDAVLAAGIANVFSAGNEGPNSETIGVPHNINTGLVNSFTVAAVTASSSPVVADFSSRGPSLCGGEGSLLIKPEVSAPGISVRSTVSNGGYDNFSGTSMAAPHVSGAVLLLKEAFPDVSGEEILLALYNSANDLGVPGEDNTYGMGMIDVEAAYELLSETNTPTPPASAEIDMEVVSINAPSATLLCDPSLTLTPEITVRNNGTGDISDFEINVQINNADITSIPANVELSAGEATNITLDPASYSVQDINELHVWISPVDNEYDVLNNHQVHRWVVPASHDLGQGLFSETFDDGISPEVWTIVNPDGNITWDTASVLQIDGATGYAAWMNHPGYNNILSQKDFLISPVMVNVDGENQNLSFDLYYRQGGNNDFTWDTLGVYLNEFCEGNLESIPLLEAGGEDLFTNDDNDNNAFPELPDEWETKTFDFTLSETAEQFYISFVSRNRRGNNLLIDNIRIGGPLGVGDMANEVSDFVVFPNPGKGAFRVEIANGKIAESAQVFNAVGQLVNQSFPRANAFTLDLNNLASGVYLLQVRLGGGETVSHRVVVQ
ncbi:MAG: S8 family serine peptidase, partial [Flavobacteriales bacterium]|nr:S8 family serine peptidase [Flavobacteriales bacterium]